MAHGPLVKGSKLYRFLGAPHFVLVKKLGQVKFLSPKMGPKHLEGMLDVLVSFRHF